MFHNFNSKSLSTIFIIFFLFSFHAYAAKPIGKFILVKGNVSILQPHSKKAMKAVRGGKIFRDASVYVNGRGVARIRLINKSSLTIGPNSKIVVDMEKTKDASLINLLSGKIRAKVTKDNSAKKKKFLVKTKSAIMGVRGTEFQVTFNNEANRSSLLTYDGQVDFKKADLKPMKADSAVNQIKAIDSDLKKGAEKVFKGEFTNVVKESPKAMKPVQIDPKQFVLLKRNKELSKKKVVLSKKEKAEIKKEIKKVEKEFKAKAPKGTVKSLGFVDSKTGIYVPPVVVDKNQELLGKTADDGSYIAPKGVSVDSKKGLIVSKEADSKTKKIVSNIDKEIKKQTPIIKKYNPEYNRYFKE